MDKDKRKEAAKLLGMETLYMILEIVTAGFSTFLQTIARKYVEDYSGFMWSGSIYQYNYFMYFLGAVVFLGVSVLLYKKFAKYIRVFSEMSWIIVTLGLILLIPWGVVMFLAMFAVLFMSILGLTNDLGPQILFLITVVGWPLLTVIFMGIIIVRNKLTAAKNS